MSAGQSVLEHAARARRAARFAAWVATTRARLGAAGVRVEIVARGVPRFDRPPLVTTTNAHVSGARERGGLLRLELGRGVHLGDGTTIEILPGARSRLALGDAVVLEAGVRLALYGGDLSVGGGTHLHDGAGIKASARCTVGARVMLRAYARVHCAEQVVLEDQVTVAERVSILDSDHRHDGTDAYVMDRPLVTTPVHVGRNSWIGANAVVLRGARVGRNAVIAAGSVVRAGDYPDGWLLAGTPAVPRRPLGPPAA